jgi:hypothetical protein
MTRRSEKQQEFAFYVPDGNAGEVWALLPDEDEIWSAALFSTKQTAEQYGEWLAKTYNYPYTLLPVRMTISTKMKKMD